MRGILFYCSTMVIGLTGQIGSGKTTAAKIFARSGAQIVDADVIGRQVVEQSLTLRKQLAGVFGREILDRYGKLKRRKLAAVAFADEAGRRKLNSLVHPYLLKELRRQVRRATRLCRLVVIDAALLLDWDMDREVDLVVVIQSPRWQRLDRLRQRGISRKDALARERGQPSYHDFRKRADHVILNNSSVERLETAIKELVASLGNAAR